MGCSSRSPPQRLPRWLHYSHIPATQCSWPWPQHRFVYIVAQQEASPVFRATLAHWEQITSGTLGPGSLGCMCLWLPLLLQEATVFHCGLVRFGGCSGGSAVFGLLFVNCHMFGRHDRKGGCCVRRGGGGCLMEAEFLHRVLPQWLQVKWEMHESPHKTGTGRHPVDAKLFSVQL